MVTPSKGLYYCFGCHDGDDEFGFLMKLYNMSFIESIHKYAEISGMDMTPYLQDMTPEEKERERLVGVMDSVVMAAQYSLFSESNQISRSKLEYLHGRGFTDDIIKEFRIGYSSCPSPTSPDFKSLELDRNDIFFDALVFPDFDPYGRPVRIYGRPFTRKNEKDPKYIGTSKYSPLYEYTIYGFHIARKYVRENGGKLILVEGQGDVAKMHQHGFKNTAGLKGTIFNDETIKLLQAFKIKEVILLLDGDDAGINATSLIVNKYLGPNRPDIRIRVANIHGYDPDEFLNAFGRTRMQEVLDNSVYAIQYVIDKVFRDKPTTTMTERMDVLREVQTFVNNADQIERKLAISDIATRLNLDMTYVEDFFKSNGDNKFQLYSVDGEKIILSECIRNKDRLIEVAERIKVDDFYLAKHRMIYQVLLDMCNKRGVDISIETVIGTANNCGIAGHLENGEYIREIGQILGTNIDWHIHDVEDKAMRRKITMLAQELRCSMNDLNVDSSQAIEMFNSRVTNIIVNSGNDKVADSGRQIDMAMSIIQDRMMNPDKMVGIHIGDRLNALSQQLRGIQPKRLHTISANQGVGKSKLLAEMCTNIAVVEQAPLLWFSYEMAAEELTLRNLAILSGISQDAMMDGTLTADQHDMLQQWALKVRQSPLFICEQGRSIEEAVAITRKYVLSEGVRVVAFDYIQLMYSGRRTEKRYQELGVISKTMKEMAGELNIGVLNVAQLGKQGKNKDLAQAEDVYGGYEIAQDSDVFITMQQKTDEQIQAVGLQKGNLLIYLDKNRGRKDDQIYNAYAHDNNARIQLV
jgi:replicative DNA helicase